MKRWWMGLFASLLVGLVGWGVYLAIDPRSLPVGAVRVEGALRHLSPVELERAVAIHVEEGFFMVDLVVVRGAVLALPWVRDATVRRVWPDRIHIRVWERQAAARWAGGGLVDVDGHLFGPSEADQPPGLPVLEGPAGTQATVLGRYRELSEWLRPLGQPIRRVSTNQRHAWQVQLQDGTWLVLGRRPLERALRRFARVFPAVLAQRGARAERVELRYPNGFSVQWRGERGAEVNGR